MTRRLVAIAYNALADPRLRAQGLPAAEHLVHEEIPDVEQALWQLGYEPLNLPVGADVLAALGTLAGRRPAALINLCDDLLESSRHEVNFAAALELIGVPYSGAPPLALALCRDKTKTKQILRAHGVPTPPFVLAEGAGFTLEGLRFPVIAKPASEDGSLGIGDASVSADEPAARRAVAELQADYGPVLVEEYIEGRELNVPVCGDAAPEVLPISEIDFGGLPPGLPRICGYEAKWRQEDPRYRGTVGICPAPLEEAARHRIEHWSLLAFRALGLRDYARVDWRLSPTRGPMFLEANPNPDISPSSGFMRSWRASGRDYPDLVRALVEAALARALARARPAA
jgi:D-alanine-D-alanine ligase